MTLSSGGSKAGEWEGGLWALLSIYLPPCEMGSHYAFLMGPWQGTWVHSRTHKVSACKQSFLHSHHEGLSLLHSPQSLQRFPGLTPKRVEPSVSRSGLRSWSLLWNHPSTQHNQVEGLGAGLGAADGNTAPASFSCQRSQVSALGKALRDTLGRKGAFFLIIDRQAP